MWSALNSTPGRQAEIYHQLRNFIPLILIFACVLATGIAFFVFRRISNPHYKDLAITDQLTQIRNRNAFEVDIGNLNASRQFKTMGILVVDLDHLKQVNDELGHIQGDLYIQKAGGGSAGMPGTAGDSVPDRRR